MRTHVSSLFTLVLAVAVPTTLWAGPVTSFEDIAFQSLTADMSVADLGTTGGSPATSLITYNGTFDQSGWSGTFGGTYQGQAVSGTSIATITGDPTWNIAGGITYGTTDTMLNMTLVENKKKNAKGQTTYRLKDTTIGGKSKWYYFGVLTESTNADGDDVLTGTLTRNYMGMLTYWRVMIVYDPIEGTIRSEFRETSGLSPRSRNFGPVIKDKGESIGLTKLAAFPAKMREGIAVVPEPATLILGGMGATLGLGFRLCMRCHPDANTAQASSGGRNARS